MRAPALLPAVEGGSRPCFYSRACAAPQKPLLAFQRAKLAFEEKLQQAGDITYSIVRPTAFFKSLAGQARGVGGALPMLPAAAACPVALPSRD